MFKSVPSSVLAFDMEWVPDPATGRVVYDLPDVATDEQVRDVMWQEGGATEEEPRPYLKTALCQVVSVAFVLRRVAGDGAVRLDLQSLPQSSDTSSSEKDILERFLGGIGKLQSKPQLVGYNSGTSDLPILLQRGVATGVRAPAFASRPGKPWEGLDYFVRFGEGHVDLIDVLGNRGRGSPRLHELAVASGIPGKMGTDGRDVIDLWISGESRRIVQYNEYDALTTYLLWLRTAHFAGHFSSSQYEEEQQLVRDLLQTKMEDPDFEHLKAYLDKWGTLSKLRDG
ncbi:3'-5' exonuclease [soil metagenome]